MLLVRRSVVAVVSVRAFVRSVSWLATDAAHTALDVVEHVVNCYAPLPKPDGADWLADEEADRDSWESGELDRMNRDAIEELRGSFWCGVHRQVTGQCPQACETRRYYATADIDVKSWGIQSSPVRPAQGTGESPAGFDHSPESPAGQPDLSLPWKVEDLTEHHSTIDGMERPYGISDNWGRIIARIETRAMADAVVAAVNVTPVDGGEVLSW